LKYVSASSGIVVGGGGASATVMVFWADVEPCAFVAVSCAV